MSKSFLVFAHACIQSLAIDMAMPDRRGPGFTWKDTFPRMATNHVIGQWGLAGRSRKHAERFRDQLVQIATRIAANMAVITASE